jgi:hypothetical protein
MAIRAYPARTNPKPYQANRIARILGPIGLHAILLSILATSNTIIIETVSPKGRNPAPPNGIRNAGLTQIYE